MDDWQVLVDIESGILPEPMFYIVSRGPEKGFGMDLFLDDQNPGDVVVYFEAAYVLADGNECAL